MLRTPRRGKPGIGEADGAIGVWREPVAGMALEPDIDTQLRARLDLDLRAQLVHPEFLQQRLRGRLRHIQKQRAFAFRHQEIEQDLALGREQGCIQAATRRQPAHNVVGYQSLEEIPRLGPGNGDYGAIVEKGGVHPLQLGRAVAVAKGGLLG